ncbi:MAG: hypothetical protein ACRDOI_23940 [Trebonia sp.]
MRGHASCPPGTAPSRKWQDVCRLFIDLLTPAELDMLAALNERILRNLAEEPIAGQSTPTR